MKRLLLRFLDLYRYWLSPALHSLFPSGCRFQPTCSQYASEAIAMHGVGRGSWLALRRLARCHPFGGSGFDPVPLRGTSAQCTEISAAGTHGNLQDSARLRDPLP
jgi:putative membrane protein insertion efficiency factor